MKKILVPCDFSPSSRSPFKYALDLAEEGGGEVIIIFYKDAPAEFSPIPCFLVQDFLHS